jgi:hypothetical protein
MEHPHNLQNYKIEREIGQGSFATVFLGHEKVNSIFIVFLKTFII